MYGVPVMCLAIDEFSDNHIFAEAKLKKNLESKWKPLAMSVIRIWSDFWVIVLKELTGISIHFSDV